MFSHVMIGANDVARLAAFYDEVLPPLGVRQRPTKPDGGPADVVWTRSGERLPELIVQGQFDGGPAIVGNGTMVASLAPDVAAVDRAHAAGLAAGGHDAGAPGTRPHDGAGYDGPYLRDPEGNKIHVARQGNVG